MARILVVEDDPTVLRLLQLAFDVEGHDTETVTDGAEALRRLEGEPVDLVLLDVMLPDVDGIEILTQLRRHPGWVDTKVVILTALEADHDLWRGWTAGTDYYLTKPFDLEQLRHVSDRLLAGEQPDGGRGDPRPHGG